MTDRQHKALALSLWAIIPVAAFAVATVNGAGGTVAAYLLIVVLSLGVIAGIVALIAYTFYAFESPEGREGPDW